jgi:hypothetical protein
LVPLVIACDDKRTLSPARPPESRPSQRRPGRDRERNAIAELYGHRRSLSRRMGWVKIKAGAWTRHRHRSCVATAETGVRGWIPMTGVASVARATLIQT